MQEPATSASAAAAVSITGGLIALFGPVIGVWMAVILSATVGATWTIGRVHTDSKRTALLILCRLVMTAIILTGGLSWLLFEKLGVAQDFALPIIAFCIGALGDKFEALKDAAIDRLKTLIGG